MRRVAALAARGPLAPSFRIRAAIPAAALRERGIEVALMPLFSIEQERRFRTAGSLGKAATILGARRTLRPQLPPPAEVAWILRQVDMLPSLALEKLAIRDRRFVLDVDDPVWLDATRAAGGHRLAFLKGTRRKLAALARRADVVVAGNAYLAEWLAAHTSKVTVIPSVVDTARSARRRHGESSTVVLGWIGSPSSFRHLERLANQLGRLARETPDIRFELHAMGGGATPRIPGVDCRSFEWSEQGEASLLEAIDVGLMPLSNDPWTRGKCAYKALQYMAAGIPVVADDVGVSAEVIGHTQAGYISRSPVDWIEGLATLARDCSLRERLGAQGRARVIADYSLSRWLPVIAQALTG